MESQKEKGNNDLEKSTFPKSPKKVKKGGAKQILNKNSMNILRTTLRNNIDLTSIADNKANVLLSLNALMLTFLVPLTLPHLDLVRSYHLLSPMLILTITCITTIYMAVNVLRPSKFSDQSIQVGNSNDHLSPFFFGNFGKMDKLDFLAYAKQVLSDENEVTTFFTNDFYHIGMRLAQKMKLVRTAYNVFMIGMSLTILLTIILIAIFS